MAAPRKTSVHPATDSVSHAPGAQKIPGLKVIQSPARPGAKQADPLVIMREALRSYYEGDFSVSLPEISADISESPLAEIFTLLNLNFRKSETLSREFTRVAASIAEMGDLSVRATVDGLKGDWTQKQNAFNSVISELARPTKEISLVMRAVAAGDLSKQITLEARGEFLELKNTINTMVEQLSAFTSEVTRVAKEVGTEGNLGVQAEVKGVAGTWKDLTEQVNALASNLTNQVRNIAGVTTAVANGDLSQKITVRAKGEILELKNTINTMVEQLRGFASEVTRVAREVGTDGTLGAQAQVAGVSGTWKDLTDSVNFLAGNLTSQVRNIALVTTAVAKGDLSKKITVEARGEVLELKNTINTMVDQLNGFSSEVTRVAREVGTYGKLGGQAEVPGVAGTWKDLTENVNQLATNLTDQVRNIALVTTAVANGDLSKKITVEARGEILELKETVNTMVEQLRAFAAEVTRVAREVGTDGKLGGQAQVLGVAGTWKDLTENVNQLASNLTNQVRNIALVTKAVAAGDLSRKITVEAKGEVLELKDTVNRMVDQLSSFASEVTRVAREVGTEGKLAGQAEVPGVAGTWKNLTDTVNTMAGNLTSQVRGIAKVVTAVANGDLTQKLLVQAKGEVAALGDTINSMTDTLRLFADQVTGVASEVGIEGKLGGQAKVPGAAGTWRSLTDNVNQLAGNLTTQVRSIAEVATAVTQGDLTRSITVDARGEVLQLKDNINQMIVNLRTTTVTNNEQDWLKSNLAKLTSMMQGQRSVQALSQLIMNELTPVVSAQYGAFYEAIGPTESPILSLVSSYAYSKRKHVSNRFALGEGIVGEAALEKKTILLTDVPEDYVHVISGLGEARPKNIGVFPVVFEGELKAIIELGSFQNFSKIHLALLEQLTQGIGIVFNLIGAGTRTEALLKELQTSNVTLEGRSKELEDQARQLEVRNNEIAQASKTLEAKAKELQKVSTYKSDFLANMSHELRTPLNSLMILAKLLSENQEGTLTAKQVDFAETIFNSGTDLLTLINEILDLSKVESGKVSIETASVKIADVRDFLEQSFAETAKEKKLDFAVQIASSTPVAISTDGARLRQILKNLLSNAFKFTEKGSVHVDIALASPSERLSHADLKQGKSVLAFAVKDTGIGIPDDQQEIIWEAFQQADPSTSRRFGGTGLGLTISRELASLLGGEIHLKSHRGEGSTFTLYLPIGSPLDLDSQNMLEDLQGHAAQHPPTADFMARIAGKRALVVDDDARGRYAISHFLMGYRLKTEPATSARKALDILKADPRGFDVVATDVAMPEMDGFELAHEIKTLGLLAKLPVVIFTSKSIPQAHGRAKKVGAAGFVEISGGGGELLQAIGQALLPTAPGAALKGRAILLIDDDARNLFAVTGYLETLGAQVFAVDNAAEGIELLKATPGIELVLMDIMMPVMDGYQATQEIRKLAPFKSLPILAVTAKAMPGEREKTFQLGFTDYVAKPIQNEQLLSAIQRHLPSPTPESLGGGDPLKARNRKVENEI